MKKIAIYGTGGHSKVIADIARLNGYDTLIFIDDNNDSCLTFSSFVDGYCDIPIIIAIGDNNVRAKLYGKCIDADLKVQTLIHPTAILTEGTIIGEGTVVMAHVVINADSTIGIGSILNTSCVIEHDNHLGDFVHLSPHVACAGNVTVGNFTHVGIGSCVIQNLNIGNNSIIGAGSVVIKNMGANILAYGNPCKQIKVIR